MPILIRLVRAAMALAMLSGADKQRAARLEMQFGQPHHVEPEPLGRVDLLHRLVEGLALGPAGQRRKLVKHAEFHDRARPLVALFAAP